MGQAQISFSPSSINHPTDIVLTLIEAGTDLIRSLTDIALTLNNQLFLFKRLSMTRLGL